MLEIAIVGIGCRFPGGVHDPSEFWDFLLRKGDGIVEIPADRWDVNRYYDADPEAPGRMYTRRGGFLVDPLWDFDPEFFGIAPREAAIMDPQQRLLLEVAVEALDDAGMGPRVGGRDVGVYVGGFTTDNMSARHAPDARAVIDSHTPTSGSFTMLSNRLSYVLDLRGPSMTIDTACSSSLVAVHQAAQALRRGECGVALAGGVNAMLAPETFISMCKGRFLAPDGRCKSFDAAADGYARGEGAGMVVLKPLAAALAHGDRVYAVVRGTGVNQDGRTSGITVPNPDAQEALARRVVGESGIDPAEIGYVEAHGTGTALGDPLEAAALGAAYGTAAGRRSALVVGSVKAAIGHTEAAAGVAGVIKAALTLHHRTIAPQAWLDTPNPQIPFDRLGIRVPTEVEPFPAGPSVPAAAVNSFGYGGTNAHVVLSAGPQVVAEPADGPRPTGTRVFPVSGRTVAAVRESALRHAELLSAPTPPAVDDACDAAWVRRVHHPFRVALTYREPAELIEQLRAVAGGTARSGARTTVRDGERPVFVFTGMGPQWWGMARDLMLVDGPFARTALAVDAAFRPIAGWSILEELLAPEAVSRVTDTRIAQPANFLVQVALCAELAAAGVEPAAVVGHSVGEVSAAYVSGALSLSDALLVSYHRARLQATTAGTGGMLAVGLPEAAALARLAPGSRVEVAAVNSPSAVTLSGDQAELAELAARLGVEGVFTTALRVEVPYHSHLMDPILPEVAASLAPVVPREPQVPLYSSVTGRRVGNGGGDAGWDAGYWCANVREPVRFADTVGALVADGHRVFLEVGPHPVLGANIREVLQAAGETGATVPTLHRGRPAEPDLAAALGELWAVGCLPAVRPPGRVGAAARHVDLPRYPWQRTRLWSEGPGRARDRLGDPGARPLLGRRTGSSAPEWETELSAATLPWLPDHVVDGVVLLPGAAYLDAALCAAAELTGRAEPALADVRFVAPLVIDEHDVPVLRVAVEETTQRLRMHSRPATGTGWTLNATARIVDGRFSAGRHDLTPPADATHVDGAELYAGLADRGLRYGPAFRGVAEAWVGRGTVLARLRPGIAAGPARPAHLAHPAVVDAALQCVAALVAADPDAPSGAVVPAAVGAVRRFGPIPERAMVLVRRCAGEGMRADIAITDEDGAAAMELREVRFLPVRPVAPDHDRVRALFYEMGWRTRPDRDVGAASAAAAAEATVLVALGPGRSPLVDLIAAGRQGVRVVTPPGCAAELLDGPGAAPVAAAVRAALTEPGRSRVTVLVVAGRDEPPGIDTVAGLLATAAAVQDAMSDTPNGAEPPRPVHAVVLTERAFGLPGDPMPPDLAHAGLIGARRTLRNEQPGCRWRLVDVDDRVSADQLLAELAGGLDVESAGSSEDAVDEVAIRDGARHVVRLAANLDELYAERTRPRPLTDPQRSYRLTPPASTLLADLVLTEVERVAPGPGQVEVATTAVGVSSKDALKAMGVLTAEQLAGTYFGTGLGMEAQGTVVRVGPGVARFAVGDRVVLSNRDLAVRYQTVDVATDGLLRPVPSSWSDVGCCSLVVFLTAHRALVDAARVQPGETVLVHGAAGGIGLAAIQVAKRRGARVIGTAGTAERREHARAAGADEVLDSRSLDFVDQVRALTSGRGVDVVLSAAPGEVLAANLAVAAEFGRVVEVGKAGIYSRGVLDLAPFDRNLTFVALDIDRMLATRRDLLVELVDAVFAEFEAGHYTELPTTRYPMSRAGEALELVARSGQVGRVALTFDDEAPVVVPARPTCRVRADAGYLVTGGFGDFGLVTARWLVESGARHLALVGRRGATTAEAKAQLAAFADAGVTVLELTADVSSPAEVAGLLGRVRAALPPLRGVFHAAGMLDDRAFTEVDAASLRRVMDPKARGAWNLHLALADVELDHFVLYSSASAITGNVPQTTYCAANTVLDTLAQLRRAQGRPALTVNWGSLAGGMAESSEEVRRYLEMIGLGPIDLRLATRALDACLALGVTHTGVLDLDWVRWGVTHPLSASTARFTEHVAAAGGGAGVNHVRAELARLPAEQRAEVLGYVLAEQLAAVLGIPAEALDLTTPLPELGLDSLMAVDLRARVNLTLDLEISALEFSRGVGLSDLARTVLPMLVPTQNGE